VLSFNINNNIKFNESLSFTSTFESIILNAFDVKQLAAVPANKQAN